MISVTPPGIMGASCTQARECPVRERPSQSRKSPTVSVGKKSLRGSRRAGPKGRLAGVMIVGEAVVARRNRLAVELDVGTHGDGLVERRLRYRSVVGDAAAGVVEVTQVAGCDRAAMDVCFHVERTAAAGIARIAPLG